MRRILLTLCCLLAALSAGLATETEHVAYRVLPTPGTVVVDGKFDEWNLAGSLFICSDVESYRDQFASWQSAMYDADNLYLLSRWIDTTPLNNPGLCGSDMGFAGDCLQVRTIVGGALPDPRADDAKTGQRTSHLTAWRGRDGRDIIDLAYGKQFNEGGVKDAKKAGAQQAFLATPDGKGYVQEIAIPWKLLTRDGRAPQAGDTFIMTYEPNFGTASKMRISTKDLFRPGVTPDRVFAFMASDRWGLAKLEAAGTLAPLPLRLSDGRTFPVTLEKGAAGTPKAGIPVPNWAGLYKDDKLEGFAKIALQMPEDGFVSLIVKNADGQVVRNLLSAKFLTKGKQEILWDGLTTPSDRKPGDPVAAGAYTWEAIWHKGLGLSLVGWAANGGKAPFDSPGGNWGGDMGGPCAVDADKDSVFLGWGASEAGKALVCTDLAGTVKWRHKRGGFGGAALVAVDNGLVFVYDQGQGNTLYRLDATKGEYANWQGSEEATLEIGKILAPFKPADAKEEPSISGLAALGGKLFLSYGARNVAWNKAQPSGNMLLILDAATGKLIKNLPVEGPGDLKVGADGKLYLVCGTTKIVTVTPETGALTPVVAGVQHVTCVAAGKDGTVYAGLGEPVNQIQLFDKAGKALRTIGKPGGRALIGPWEKTGVRFVTGLKVDAAGKLWVMENDGAPRRISVWDAQTGAFVKEFFGPTDYGAGGGAICPADPYTLIGQHCEWKLTPESGKAECVAVISRGHWSNARFGTGKDGRIYAAVGGGWPAHRPVQIYERLAAGKWKLRTVISTDEEHQNGRPQHLTVWSDRNDDGQPQPDEQKKYELALGGWIDGWYMYFNQAMTFAGGDYRIDVTGWTPCGAPEYDLAKAVKLPAPIDPPHTARGGMGAQKTLVSEDGNYVLYNGFYGVEHSDFSCLDVRTGKLLFAYPNNYVGVHGGHLAPPAKTGLIRGAYDIVGTVKMPAPLGNLFAIGTDKGEWHLLSSSGFYVASLFQGDAMKIAWPDDAVPGANMNDVPPGMGAEDFGGSIIKANDGNLYVQCGKTAFINCKVSGLDTVKSLGTGTVKLTADDVVKAQGFKVKYLSVTDVVASTAVKKKRVVFTGNPGVDFGTQQMVFGADNAGIRTWLAHDDTNLYVAWHVDDKTPWINGATGFENLYACGDTVDLQLGVDPTADRKRRDATKGDLRLSIGQLQGQTIAVLYRKVSAEKSPKTFYSGTSKGGYVMDFVKRLDGVTIDARPTAGKSYVVEAAIPLTELGITLQPGLKLRGDLGVTYSDPEGKDTNLRVYWSNKATGIVADEVEELKMQPALWGEFILE
jgi:hypothetical protein